MGSGLKSFIETVPEYEVRSGQMHITIGGDEIVVPLHVFLKGVARAEEAIAKWHVEQLGKECSILELPGRG